MVLMGSMSTVQWLGGGATSGFRFEEHTQNPIMTCYADGEECAGQPRGETKEKGGGKGQTPTMSRQRQGGCPKQCPVKVVRVRRRPHTEDIGQGHRQGSPTRGKINVKMRLRVKPNKKGGRDGGTLEPNDTG